MHYLKLRSSKHQTLADGTPFVVALYVHKSRKYGKVISEKTISRKKPILVVGAHDSGKTRWLKRMFDKAQGLWGAKIKAAPLWIAALRPIAAWCEEPGLIQWWEQQRQEEEKKAQEDTTIVPRRPWSNLKQWERVEKLPEYIQETGAVLFVDDAHKLSGRKLDLVRQCALVAKLWVVSASEEQRIAPNLRAVLMRRDPPIYRLNSEVAYDATGGFMWALIVVLFAAGFWEASLVLGGLKALGAGRRATRQD